MEPWSVYVCSILCVFGLLAGVLAGDWIATGRIRDAFWMLSSQLGLDLSGFRLFTLGMRPVLTPIKRGKGNAADLIVFSYRYLIPGQRRMAVSQTIVWMRCRAGKMPDFAIQPKRHWLFSEVAFGARDIDIESHPEFSRMYLLRGGDEPAIRHLFNADVLDFFESHPGLSVEAVDNRIIYYRHNECILPDAVTDLIKEARELLARSGAALSPDGWTGQPLSDPGS